MPTVRPAILFFLFVYVLGAQAQCQMPADPGAGQNQGGAHAAGGAQTPAASGGQTPAAGSGEKAPQYDNKSFEVLTGVGAVLAGVEDTSYSINTDTNALAATNIGRKRIELLLGGGFIMPFHRGGKWIENAFPNDNDYKDYRPWETFLSIRFAPGSDQTVNGFVVGGGYRITKYFSLLIGYSATPMDEPSPGFRLAASQIVTTNPTIFPYSRYNASDLLNNKPGAFDGFPLFIYNANGVTTQKLFLTNPTVTHHRSGVYFGVGIPVNLASLLKPNKSNQ